jgi:hypothetical protein
MSLVTLFHGSNQDFEAVDLSKSRDKRDYGRGFYMTTMKVQAMSWARNMFIRHKGSGQYVYEFVLEISTDLKVKHFGGISPEWLDMVKRNRIHGGTRHEYDIVRGPVADDNTMRTLALFVAGIYDEETALRQLKFFKINDQVSIHTERALAKLKMVGKSDGG